MHPIVIHALVKSRMEQDREAERRRLAQAEMPREHVLSRAGTSALSITGVALGWRRPRRGVAVNHGKAAVWVISPRGLPAESWADSPLPEVVTDLAPCEWTPGTAPGGTKSRRERPMHVHPILSGQLAHERQREMLAQANRLRLAREVRHASLVTQRAEPSPRRKGLLFWRTRLAVSQS